MDPAGQGNQSLNSGISLFDLAKRRLDWLDQRQNVLARNIANLDTPGFTGVDLKPFEATVQQAQAAGQMEMTSPMHLSGASQISGLNAQIAQEVAPDGNSVSLEEQLTRVADTQSAQALVTNLYTRYMSMMRLALGRNS